MKKISVLTFYLFTSLSSFMQSVQPWQGKSCAVVLTYDDAIDQHLDNVVPLLDSLGLKATHTLYHPCMGGTGREWVKPEYDLRSYTVQRMVDETRMTNLFLQSLDGKTRRTFAFTCGDMKIGDSSFMMAMKNDFVAARVVNNQMHQIKDVDLYQVDCYLVNGQNGEQLIAWVKKAMETHSLLVILFHGVGGGNSLNVSLPAHRQFLQYLKQNEKNIMITTMIKAADHIKSWQAGN